MKKFFLLAVLFVASLGFTAYAESATEIKNKAITFHLNEEIKYKGNSGPEWYVVNLEEVGDDENLLLYLNNMSTTEKANVSVKAATISDYISVLAEEERVLNPKHNYAKSIPHGLFGKMDSVYVQVESDQDLVIAAHPVEPGELDLDCLNAPEVSAGETVTINATTEDKWSWYAVSVADVRAAADKSLQVTVTNLGTQTAEIVGGVSMDCPSSGTIDKSLSLAAGASRNFTLKRSYIDLVGDNNLVYVGVKTNQKVRVELTQVNAPAVETVEVVDAQEFMLDTYYILNAGKDQWFKVKVADFNVSRMLPQLTVENTDSKTATVSGELVYGGNNANLTSGEVAASRSFAVAAGAAWIKEVERNLIEAVATNNEYVYVHVSASANIRFIATLLVRNAGVECNKAIDFDWINGNYQTANTPVWYAVNIENAKDDENKNKNILITVKNLSGKQATITGHVAFACPADATEDITRVIAAGSSISHTLKYATYMYLDDVVYVGLDADQDVYISAELVDGAEVDRNICTEFESVPGAGDGVVEFDLEDGAPQDPSHVWYSVNLRDLQKIADKEKLVPEIVVTNIGTGTATIFGELAFECDVKYELQNKTIWIGAGEEYTWTPAMSLIESVDADYAYIHVFTDQPITIKVRFKHENEGLSCASAENFDWNLGVDYKAAEPYWYAVNVAEALEKHKGIILTVTNNMGAVANVKAEATIECPVESGTFAYNFNVVAQSSISREIKYATLAAVGADVVYVCVTSNQNLHISASLNEEDDSNLTEICDDENLNWVVFDNFEEGIILEETDTWVKVPLEQFKNGIVPKVTVINGIDSENEITAELTFNCAVDLDQMMGRTIVLNANGSEGDTYERTADKSLLALIKEDQDTAYIHVVSQGKITINTELVDANDGSDCYNAVNFDFENGHRHEADATVWYKVDLNTLRDKKQSLTVGIENLDGFDGKVTANFYFFCQDEAPFESYSYNLVGGQKREVELGYELINAMSAEFVYIELYAAQTDSLYVRLKDINNNVEMPEGCEDAINAQLNYIYSQEAGGQWYSIDLDYIMAKDGNGEYYTSGDALLEIWNSDAENNLTAVLAWSCDPEEALLDRTMTLTAGQEYQRIIARSLIENVAGKHVAYIYVDADQDMKFRVTMKDVRGKNCQYTPIEYNWATGAYHPGDDNLCYHIDLSLLDLDENKDKDLRVSITNLADEVSHVTAYVRSGFAVGDDLTTDGPLVRDLKKGESLSKDISHGIIDGIFTDGKAKELYVELESDGNVYLYAELIGKIDSVIEVTVDTILCAGETFYYDDPENEGEYLSVELTDEKEYPIVLTATYQITVDKTIEADSVVTYNINRRTMPTLPALSDVLTVYAGRAIDYDKVTADILDSINTINVDKNGVYYDTLAHVIPQSIRWEAWEDEDKEWIAVPTDKIDFELKNITLRYTFETKECGDLVNGQYGEVLKVDVSYTGYDTIHLDTLCVGQSIEIKGITVTGSATEKVQEIDVEILDTETYKAIGQDSLTYMTYVVYTWQNPELVVEDVDNLISAQVGKTIDTSDATDYIRDEDLKGQAEGDDLLVALVEDGQGKVVITWEIHNGSGYETLTDAHLKQEQVAADGTITLRYSVTTACGETLYSEDIVITPDAIKVVEENKDEVVVCVGELSEKTHDYPQGKQIDGKESWKEEYLVEDTDQDYWYVVTYNYNVYVNYTDVTVNSVDAQLGSILTSDDAEALLVAELDAQGATVTRTEIKWTVTGDVQLGGRLTYNNTVNTITLHYEVVTNCGTLTGDITVNVTPAEVVEKSVVVGPICLGDGTYELVDRVETIVPGVNRFESLMPLENQEDSAPWKDVHYTYEITVYTPIEFTADELTTEVDIICGQPINVEALEAEIQGILALAEIPQDTPNGIQWQVSIDGAELAPLTDEVIPYGAGKTVVLHYTIDATCDLIEGELTYTIQEASSFNVYNEQEATVKYEGWLLMINYNTISDYTLNTLGLELTEDMVEWYRMTGATIDRENDEFLGNGYYYTETEVLPAGIYYAVISVPETDEECGIFLYTNTLEVGTAPAALTLAPNMVQPGDNMYLTGLNADNTYVISVYDLTGICVERYEVKDTESFTLQAQSVNGYYMVEVNAQSDNVRNETFKYVVK